MRSISRRINYLLSHDIISVYPIGYIGPSNSRMSSSGQENQLRRLILYIRRSELHCLLQKFRNAMQAPLDTPSQNDLQTQDYSGQSREESNNK